MLSFLLMILVIFVIIYAAAEIIYFFEMTWMVVLLGSVCFFAWIMSILLT